MQTTAMTRRASQFDIARDRAKEQEGANLQTQKDAMARKLAASGGGPGGVGIKLDQQVSDASAKRLADANQGIDAAETADIERKAETEAGRAFATSERIGSQGFASDQGALARRFATSEREGSQGFQTGILEQQQKFSTDEREAGQEFASGEAGLQREFATGERLGGEKFASTEAGLQRTFAKDERVAGQTFATGEREGSQDFASSEAGLNRDFQKQQGDEGYQREVAVMYAQQAFQDWQGGKQMDFAMQQLEHEKSVDAFNMDLATKMFEEEDFMESLLGNPLSPDNPGSAPFFSGRDSFLNGFG